MESLPKLAFIVLEKVDGFLGGFYRGPDGPALASRGSFTSEMAKRGTAFLRQCGCLDELPQNYTPLFEIVYPNKLLAVQYDFEGLVLLAIKDRFSGAELKWSEVEKWAKKLGIRTPKIYSFASAEEAAKSLYAIPADVEGYVLRFSNGFRAKLKGRAYLERFRALRGITSKTAREMIVSGQYSRWLAESVPEELRDYAKELAEPLLERTRVCEKEARELFAAADKKDRRTLALWTKKHDVSPRHQAAIFILYENREPNWHGLALKE